MSTTITSDSVVITPPPAVVAAGAAAAPPPPPPPPLEVESATCDCCGLTEECTVAYVQRIRETYRGKWICGLCEEAVKDEAVRYQRLITAEEALNRHLNFCKTFQSSSPPHNPNLHLITAMRHVLRKSLDSPKLMRSMASSPTKKHAATTTFKRSELELCPCGDFF